MEASNNYVHKQTTQNETAMRTAFDPSNHSNSLRICREVSRLIERTRNLKASFTHEWHVGGMAICEAHDLTPAQFLAFVRYVREEEDHA